jgi:glycosyltransferase involved in cell wall biosynthesis
MRVLHVIPAVAAQYGGPSVAVIGMCRALRATAIDAVIATTDADGSRRLPVDTGIITEHLEVPTIFFRRQATESFKWSTALASWLDAHVREFDLVHVHAVFSHSSLAAGRACRAANVPYIVRPLGSLDPWSLDRHPRRKQLLMAFGARRFLAGARAMHYTTDAERRLAGQRLAWLPQGHVVPLAIDDEFFAAQELPRRRETPVLVSMCRLHPKKGIELLIDAFHRVSAIESLAPWRLVIVGDGDPDYVGRLRTAAAAGPAAARIEFKGWLSGTARREQLRNATLFVLPSQQENFGIALVEAMASALPAVVTPAVNLADDLVAADAGWVCDADVASLSQTLRVAMDNPGLLERRGQRARDLANRFTWPSVADELRMLYEKVLGRRVALAHDAVRVATSP